MRCHILTGAGSHQRQVSLLCIEEYLKFSVNYYLKIHLHLLMIVVSLSSFLPFPFNPGAARRSVPVNGPITPSAPGNFFPILEVPSSEVSSENSDQTKGITAACTDRHILAGQMQ